MRWIVVPVHPLDEPLQTLGATQRPTSMRVGLQEPEGSSPLARWLDAARRAVDPCVVVDTYGRVAAMSPSAAQILSPGGEDIGRLLVDDVISLLDFSDPTSPASAAARRIPPLIAAQEDQLSRGVMRIRGPAGRTIMLDAIAAPLHDEQRNVVGSLAFFTVV